MSIVGCIKYKLKGFANSMLYVPKAAWKKALCVLERLRQAVRKRDESRKRHRRTQQLAKQTAQRRLTKTLTHNPYLQSRALWNDLYGEVQTRLENSYRMMLVMIVVIGISIAGLILLARQRTIKPFLAVIHGDEVLSMDQMLQKAPDSLQDRLSLYFAKQFIHHARTVYADAQANTQNQIAAFSLVKGAAVQILKHYYKVYPYRSVDPDRVKRLTVTSILRRAPKTLVIRWQSVWQDRRSGKQLSKTKHYLAEIQYRYQAPAQDKVILHYNPLGFYITQLAWSEDNS